MLRSLLCASAALATSLLAVRAFAQPAQPDAPAQPAQEVPPPPQPPPPSPQAPAPEPAPPNTVTLGNFAATLYGFVEADYIYDSTQSFGEQIGNAQVERPDPHPLPPPAAPITYKGDHGRMTFSIRNSRFGIRVGAQSGAVKPSATLEMDFLGPAPTTTEAALFTTPVLRLRHAYFKLETPVIDALVGQTWRLFGWQGMAFPASVQILGIPGQIYSRGTQLRLSKTVHAGPVTLDAAIAAARPAQRDGAKPDLEAGVKIAFDDWRGTYTSGATSTSLAPLSLGVSGIHRQLTLPELDALPKATVDRTADALAVDLVVPVLPANKTRRDNSLVLVGEAVAGEGIADLYSGLAGGIAFPTVANTTGINPPPTYPQNVDNGLVVYDLDGNLYAVRVRSLLAGLQYTLPGLGGDVWITANYARIEMVNADEFTRPVTATLPNPQQSYYVSAAQVRDSLDYFDANVFVQIVDGVRVGAGYANLGDRYVDGVRAVHHRGQLSGYFIF